MFETEYKQMMDGIAPSTELISDTLAKAQPAARNKRLAPRVRGSLVLAAILLLGIISASAITLRIARVFDMKGADVTEEYLSPQDQIAFSATPSPSEKQARTLVGASPANEYWVIYYEGNSRYSNTPGETLTSLEDFEKRIASSGSRFLIPQDIPAGYVFESAEIEFYLNDKSMEEGLIYLGTEQKPEGVRIYKYRAPENIKNNIIRYRLRFENDHEAYLAIDCDLGQLDSEYHFIMGENGTGELVPIKGMLEVVFLKDKPKNRNELFFRTMYLPDEKIVCWPDSPPPKQPGNGTQEGSILKQPAGGWPYMICNTMDFSIRAPALDKDQLIKIAQSLR